MKYILFIAAFIMLTLSRGDPVIIDISRIYSIHADSACETMVHTTSRGSRYTYYVRESVEEIADMLNVKSKTKVKGKIINEKR